MNWTEELKHLVGWSFGDNPVHADMLGKLVANGKKTATTGLFHYYETQGLPLPKPGQRSYIKNSRGEAICIIEMTQVDLTPFQEVTHAYAILEAWDDLSYESWADVHRQYFKRLLPAFTDDMKVVCMQFKVVHQFAQNSG